ncbi:hypothetical protein ACLOJK_009262 [Asimina triloba]
MKVSSSISSPSSVMESAAADPPPEILPWLKSLPLAPEFHPTLAEFQDPISYILKIEPQASKFGICKIVPPLQPSPKKTAFSHLGRSFSAAHPQKSPVFPTRHQEIGLCPRRSRPALKTVWESGESYTLQQFELKSKQFEKTHLKKSGKKGPVALEEETQFWKATADRPFTVECASGIPGSGFAPASSKRRRESSEEALTVADTEWNMRVVSRAKGSLLVFVDEEAGVTSPVVDVGMAFSWFAWQVEEQDLHGLNYLHFGAEKTWYGVPMDAAAAFEDVVRVQGYGGEVNPLVAFATLCEKTTVMSPEVLIGAGVPCCRLVQNAGEFVVTFPRAYHTGFSHGFNCGEAATIATPEWLRIAKDAAIRRAAINCPPRHSHIQLLHALAMTLCSRTPMGVVNEPRSSRLKDKKRGEGDVMVKELFVQNLSLGLRNPKDTAEGSESSHSDDIMSDRNSWFRRPNGLCSAKGKLVSVCQEGMRSATKYSQYGINDSHTSASGFWSVDGGKEPTSIGGSLFDQGQFLCVTCGIQCFPCMAIIQAKAAAAMHLILNDPDVFNEVNGHAGLNGDVSNVAGRATDYSDMDLCSGQMLKDVKDHLASNHGWFNRYQIQSGNQRGRPASNSVSNGISSLDLLAFAYGDPSDSEEELVRPNTFGKADDLSFVSDREDPEIKKADAEILAHPSRDSSKEIPAQASGHICASHNVQRITTDGHPQTVNFSSQGNLDDCCHTSIGNKNSLHIANTDDQDVNSADLSVPSEDRSCCISDDTEGRFIEITKFGNMETPAKNPKTPVSQLSDIISSKFHIFCLEHAVEVVKFLQSVGGADVLLLCHHDYPKIEEEAKKLAEELVMDHLWKDTAFREANTDEYERVRCALDYQEAIPSTGDWTVKLGINFHYSTSLSRSPLYSKMMPYNSVICKAFGLHSLCDSVAIPTVSGKRPGRQKKIFVAGRWCGKVWMSNQVHPYLACRDTEEQENIKLHINIPKPNLRFDGDFTVDVQRMIPKRESSAVETEKEKTGKKRRKSFEKSATKKPKLAQSIDTPKPAENSPENTSPKHGRVLRSRTVKCGTIPSQPGDLKKSISQKGLNSEVEGVRSMSLRRRPLKQQEVKAKSEVTEDTKSKREVRKRKLTGERELKNNLKKRSSSMNAKPKKDEEAGHLYKKTCATESQVKKKNMKKVACNKNIRVKEEKEVEYQCDIEGCSMSFSTKRELSMHKQNICLVKGCGKKLFSHKYMAQHQRVHVDFRPLKCPWKGCRMTFKWAWARTEHMRVHTGARPYQCAEPGCGQTFRFVSDFSRHRRKTGHAVRKKRSKG